ncbi:MAG: glutathione S-transferase family protein [Magnetococcales bacterium]|nr:glutathione S-transferase family protein [Magnetococcales bacterium]
MKLELVSYKICPYVQRAAIALLHTKTPFELTHIMPGQQPDWFWQISPLGQVPLLKVDDNTVLFDSTVLGEFVNDITPEPLLPEDPIQRANARGWVQFASACQGDFSAMISADSEEGFNKARDALLKKLKRLDNALEAEPWFLGTAFSLVDAAFAPLWMRLAVVQESYSAVIDLSDTPKAVAWSKRLLALPEVKDSVVPELPRLFKGFILKKRSYLAKAMSAK